MNARTPPTKKSMRKDSPINQSGWSMFHSSASVARINKGAFTGRKKTIIAMPILRLHIMSLNASRCREVHNDDGYMRPNRFSGAFPPFGSERL
ncbi:MAG: hypothetical protein ACJZ56_03860 [Candidatus Thalassarchaeaceae archaeon]